MRIQRVAPLASWPRTRSTALRRSAAPSKVKTAIRRTPLGLSMEVANMTKNGREKEKPLTFGEIKRFKADPFGNGGDAAKAKNTADDPDQAQESE